MEFPPGTPAKNVLGLDLCQDELASEVQFDEDFECDAPKYFDLTQEKQDTISLERWFGMSSFKLISSV